MKEISKVGVIYDAFMDTILGDLPKNKKDYPDWYKERLEKCDACRYNTKNIPLSLLPIGLYISSKVGKARCSICGCFIKQKAWAKTEECAIAETNDRPLYIEREKDEKPRWSRLEFHTVESDEFNLISTDHKKYNIGLSEDENSFQIKLNPTEKGENIKFSFILQSKHKMAITQIHASCGCTNPELELIDRYNHKVFVEVNTKAFGLGDFKKSLDIYYKLDDNVYKEGSNGDLIHFEILGHIKE